MFTPPRWKRAPRIRTSKYSHLSAKQFADLQRESARVREERRVNLYRTTIWEYKRAHPCIDCGEDDPVVLEFDHRDQSEKSCGLGKPIAIGRFYEEVKKCDVRCANCHRKRTAVQLGFWKNLWDDGERSKVKIISERATRENTPYPSILDEFQ